MCTFTLIRWPDGRPGYRLLFNRDEQRSRPRGQAPTIEVFGKRQAILPKDPVAGGTWIGVNDAGLCLALLNVYPVDARLTSKPSQSRRRSRGWIIRSMLAHSLAGEAIRAADGLEHEAYPPFTLLAADETDFASLRWDGSETRSEIVPLTEAPFLYVSSGLGDRKVEPPRRALFKEMIEGASASELIEQQDAFHRHQWPDKPELSVCMARSDAMTLSMSCVEVESDEVRMRYHPKPPNEPAEPTSMRLARSRESA